MKRLKKDPYCFFLIKFHSNVSILWTKIPFIITFLEILLYTACTSHHFPDEFKFYNSVKKKLTTDMDRWFLIIIYSKCILNSRINLWCMLYNRITKTHSSRNIKITSYLMSNSSFIIILIKKTLLRTVSLI